MKICSFIIAIAWLAFVTSAMSFTNPASRGPGAQDFSKNTVFPKDSVINIQWTEGTEGTTSTVTLWQCNTSSTDTIETIGDLQYITSKGIAFFSTDVHLTIPWNFGFLTRLPRRRKCIQHHQLLVDRFDFDGFSHFKRLHHELIPALRNQMTIFLNISDNTIPSSSESTVSTLSATVAATTLPSIPSSTTGSSPVTSPTAASINSTSGLGVAAKAGIGVGVALVGLIAISAGWLLFRRRNGDRQLGSQGLQDTKVPDESLPPPLYEASGREAGRSVGPYELYE